ncbi:MAG: hypothetical protein PHE24_06240 [Patescibacteria group bacterium]|nr:hypothetical protein [Patescibacteria group bacterium]
MQLDAKIEEKIKEEMIRLTSVGRTNWDTRHTLCAVKWMKKLIAAEGGDERILIPAIYFHDTGYENLGKSYGLDEVMDAKKGHAEQGAGNALNFLSGLKYFTPEELKRICYLIANHDKHKNITEPDRQLILEADGLGQIDWENCPPSFDKKNRLRFINEILPRDRIPFIKTTAGKRYFNELLEKAKKL